MKITIMSSKVAQNSGGLSVLIAWQHWLYPRFPRTNIPYLSINYVYLHVKIAKLAYNLIN
jgi:hypothetical protein